MSNTPSSGLRDTWILAVCQGLFTAAISVDLTLTGLTGFQLAPDKRLATLPFALITVSGAVVTLAASFLMQRLGRRRGFALGACSGACGGAISAWSVINHHFWAFCIGTAAVGIFQSFAQYYRLAAADAVGAAGKSRAVSRVLTGGVAAAILGPLLAAWTKDLVPGALFAGAYLMVSALGLMSMALLISVYRETPKVASKTQASVELPRRLAVVGRQPIFVASVANNVVGSAVMMLIMTAAPLAAVAGHHSIDDGANIIQWHLVGMYAPSFVAGALIQRYGLPAILFAGMALNAICIATASTSTHLLAFHVALLCLGIGWNFMFVGGTTLLAQSYRPSERAKVQGFAELIRYVVTAAATLVAGPVLARYGWSSLNLAMLPVLALAALMTTWWVMAERRVPVLEVSE